MGAPSQAAFLDPLEAAWERLGGDEEDRAKAAV